MKHTGISDIRVVATSFVFSVFDVILNLAVAFYTGSTAMLVQGLQGLSDLMSTSPFNEHLVSFLEPGGVSRWAHS